MRTRAAACPPELRPSRRPSVHAAAPKRPPQLVTRATAVARPANCCAGEGAAARVGGGRQRRRAVRFRRAGQAAQASRRLRRVQPQPVHARQAQGRRGRQAGRRRRRRRRARRRQPQPGGPQGAAEGHGAAKGRGAPDRVRPLPLASALPHLPTCPPAHLPPPPASPLRPCAAAADALPKRTPPAASSPHRSAAGCVLLRTSPTRAPHELHTRARRVVRILPPHPPAASSTARHRPHCLSSPRTPFLPSPLTGVLHLRRHDDAGLPTCRRRYATSSCGTRTASSSSRSSTRAPTTSSCSCASRSPRRTR